MSFIKLDLIDGGEATVALSEIAGIERNVSSNGNDCTLVMKPNYQRKNPFFLKVDSYDHISSLLLSNQ